MFRRFLSWLTGKPSTPRREPAPPKAAARPKARFDEKLVDPVDDDKTVRDTSDDQTIKDGGARGAPSLDPPPAGFRFNPNLMAAMPAGDPRLSALAREIAEHAQGVPMAFRSAVLGQEDVTLSGTPKKLRVLVNLPWEDRVQELRAMLAPYGIELEGIDVHK